MKIQEYRLLLKKQTEERKKAKRAKYGNVKTHGCPYGFTHRSRLEAAVCQMNFDQERAGEIEHLEHECRIDLTDSKIGYVADFKLRNVNAPGMEPGEIFFREAKGAETNIWRLKKRLYRNYGPGKLEIWGGYHTRPYLQEVIIPKGQSFVVPRSSTKQLTLDDVLADAKNPRKAKGQR